jgi:hypothetical protein
VKGYQAIHHPQQTVLREPAKVFVQGVTDDVEGRVAAAMGRAYRGVCPGQAPPERVVKVRDLVPRLGGQPDKGQGILEHPQGQRLRFEGGQ